MTGRRTTCFPAHTRRMIGRAVPRRRWGRTPDPLRNQSQGSLKRWCARCKRGRSYFVLRNVSIAELVRNILLETASAIPLTPPFALKSVLTVRWTSSSKKAGRARLRRCSPLAVTGRPSSGRDMGDVVGRTICHVGRIEWAPAKRCHLTFLVAVRFVWVRVVPVGRGTVDGS
ncbi:hypothetical protein B296_00018557 [Ensete ventricosum]|uniref:Uncharacterized protein n=1 Tax=Ensete ventricosum TaxID=4639 RepID=A0A427AUE9_ENSVE|nr:hypothetical protein B296_00018557 [Ensete ventricosum]